MSEQIYSTAFLWQKDQNPLPHLCKELYLCEMHICEIIFFSRNILGRKMGKRVN